MAPPTTKLYTLSLHDALPIFNKHDRVSALGRDIIRGLSLDPPSSRRPADRSLWVGGWKVARGGEAPRRRFRIPSPQKRLRRPAGTPDIFARESTLRLTESRMVA